MSAGKSVTVAQLVAQASGWYQSQQASGWLEFKRIGNPGGLPGQAQAIGLRY
jgi:hypothetical protein